MSKFVINNIDSLNLLLDKVKSTDPGSYEFINRYFQALLENDNFLMRLIQSQISDLRKDLESGEIVIPSQETGPTGIGALGVPTFIGEDEPDVDATVDYIWFKPIRKTEVVVPDTTPVVTFILEAEERDDGWHIQVDDILKAIENASSDPNDLKDGEYLITPIFD